MRPVCRCFRLLTHAAPLVEENLPLREPGPHEVLVRIRAVGVCHSDLFLQEGAIDAGTGRKIDMTRTVNAPDAYSKCSWENPMPAANRKMPAAACVQLDHRLQARGELPIGASC